MTETAEREAFLAGRRPADVHIYLHEDVVSNPSALATHGELVDDGVVLVLDGEQARGVFQETTGIDPMALAGDARATEGDVDRDCAGATCPVGGRDHQPRLIFAFAEGQNESAGGLYAEGPVVHAYVACGCGERYSDRWVADR